MKHSHAGKSRVINASNEHLPRPLLLLVSEAHGGGRSAFILKKPFRRIPKAASSTGGFFVASLLSPTSRHDDKRLSRWPR
jgi:hypothetical protein